MTRKLLLITLLLICLGQIFAQIVIYGDTRTQPQIHAQVVNKFMQHQPKIVFHTGDLNHHGKAQSEYDEFKQIVSPIAVPFYPLRGNHEKDLSLFLRNYPGPADSLSYYTVDYDSLSFIILDSVQSIQPGSKQFQWLEEKMSAAKYPIILLLHHPIFSSGPHGDELWLRPFMPAFLQKHDVKAVFCGHEHCFEHLFYENIHYIVTGGGGAPLRPMKEKHPYSLKFVMTHHYNVLSRSGNNLKIETYDLEDKIINTFQINL